jgi:hypothetical protein
VPKAKAPPRPKPVYSFDTTAFIQPYRRYYPPDIAPTFWRALEDRIAAGEIVSIRNVRAEIEEKDDALCTWVKAQKGLFRNEDMAIQARTAQIVAKYPNWVDATSGKNDADPWVISLAMVEKITVVSDEQNGGPSNLKIPYVCGQLGVNHLSVIDFIRAIGLRW